VKLIVHHEFGPEIRTVTLTILKSALLGALDGIGHARRHDLLWQVTINGSVRAAIPARNIVMVEVADE
jgi:hypothetical protein